MDGLKTIAELSHEFGIEDSGAGVVSILLAGFAPLGIDSGTKPLSRLQKFFIRIK